MGGKAVRVIAGIIVVLVIAAGVDSDSSEVRSVTLSGEDYA